MAGSPYLPHTAEDISAMLERIDVPDLDALYSDIPSDLKLKAAPELPEALSEQEVRDFFMALDAKNPRLKVFVGAGAYDHYTPSVIPYITSRSEFLTAYTPYQCEISQGTLRYIFEFQSMICALTGLDCANASMYDGATAAAEAAMMAISSTKKKDTVIISGSLLPNVIKVICTYATYHGFNVLVLIPKEGETPVEALKECLAEGNVAGLIVPSVNRYGIIEDHTGLADVLHEAGALLIEYCDPSALAVVKSPAEWGADIAVGDGQSLGIPLCYGGPYVGFMAAKKDYLRKLPGRIVGETVDKQGRRSYVLTLQAREQHIRREKATSNICSNQSLMALWTTVYCSLMGPAGLREVNRISSDGAHYLKARLLETGLFEDVFPGKPFLKEFVLKPLIDPEKLQKKLLEAGFFAALETEEGFVSFCVTEKRSKAEVDALVETIKNSGL